MRAYLETIIAATRQDVARRMRCCPERELAARAQSNPRTGPDFAAALRGDTIRLIGELKRASPSKGALAPALNVASAARLYAEAGVSAISVLTDKHFQGSYADLSVARQTVALPLLCKDFIISTYQLYEAFAAGADAVLLIAAVLGRRQLSRLAATAAEIGLAALVEIHQAQELEELDFSLISIVGINNRDLRDFSVDLQTTARLAPLLPATVIRVAESGFRTRQDMLFAQACGMHAVLVGESIVAAPDSAGQIRHLLGRDTPAPDFGAEPR